MNTLATTGLLAVIPDFIVTWLVHFHNQYAFVGTLMILMIIDVATGLLAASVTQSVSSKASWSGMNKKVMVLFAVATGVVFEPYCNLPLGRMIAMLYTATEGISITENMSRAGLPVPKFLRDMLENMKSKDGPETSTTNSTPPQVAK